VVLLLDLIGEASSRKVIGECQSGVRVQWWTRRRCLVRYPLRNTSRATGVRERHLEAYSQEYVNTLRVWTRCQVG
jgi:hypothetical protein